MSVLYLLILFSLVVAVVFLVAFVVSVRRGQFDDTYSPGRRILFDDTPTRRIPEDSGPNENRKHHAKQ